jgi:DnaJ-class molecular chaperone
MTLKCEPCKGSGKILREIEKAKWGTSTRAEPCEACNGRGTVQAGKR